MDENKAMNMTASSSFTASSRCCGLLLLPRSEGRLRCSSGTRTSINSSTTTTTTSSRRPRRSFTTPKSSVTASSSSHRNDRVVLLAHMNFARLRAPLNDPSMAEFHYALAPVNALAKSTPGFVWSLDLDDDLLEEQRSNVELLRHDELLMVQLSLWKNIESIQHFAYKSGHAMYLKRKREWFTSPDKPFSVCWWWPITTTGGSIIEDDLDGGRNDKKTIHLEGNEDCSHRSFLRYPTLQDAFERLEILRMHGPTEDAFTFKTSKDFPKPF